MKKSLRFISLVLAAALAAGSMTACGSGGKSQTGTKTSGAATQSFPLKEKVTFKFLTHEPTYASQDLNQRLIAQRLEKETGVHIEWTTYVDDQFGDKKKLALAKKAGLPDAIFDAQMSNYDLLHYAKQGVIVPLDSYIKKGMPNLNKILNENPKYKAAVTAPDGHIYSFPWIEELGSKKGVIQAVGAIPWINKKWLDQLGLSVPKTTDDLEKVLLAFKEKKPAGKNTIPMSFRINKINEDPGVLLGAFGKGDTSDHYMVDDNGKVFYSLTQNGYKNGINWMHKLYQDGVIDPEVFTQDDSTYISKAQGDRIGLFFSWDRENMASNNVNDYIALPALTGPDGTKNVPRANAIGGLEVGRMVVTSADNDPALTAKWVDELYKPQQSIQDNWGTYGDTKNDNIFEMSGNMLKHLTIKSGVAPYELRMKTNLGGPLAVLNSYYGKYSTMPSDAEARIKVINDTYVPDMKAKNIYPPVFMEMDTTNRITQIETDLVSYAEGKKAEWLMKGGVDAQWNEYLGKMNSLGLSELLQLKQKGYDSYMQNQNGSGSSTTTK